MLEHLSPKFRMPPMEREARAALILNRFTRTLTIMFATNAVSSILGVQPDQMVNKSFYECIQENCLGDALKCLESAKANDSIAYLRFWYRDPRREEDTDISQDDEIGGNDSEPCRTDAKILTDTAMAIGSGPLTPSAHLRGLQEGSFPANGIPHLHGQQGEQLETYPLELEAVVSCTSDGLVVVLRRARPPIPVDHPPLLPFDFENGLFAAPWGQQSITPSFPLESLHSFRPPLLPQFMPLRENVKAAGGLPMDQLMRSIRDVAVFAWALVGINGNVAAYGRGVPMAESQLPSDCDSPRTRPSVLNQGAWSVGTVTEESGRNNGGEDEDEAGDADVDGDRGGDRDGDEARTQFHRSAVSPHQVFRGLQDESHDSPVPSPIQSRQGLHLMCDPPLSRGQGARHLSPWGNQTTTTDRGRADRGCSYGVTTSQADISEHCKIHHYAWP